MSISGKMRGKYYTGGMFLPAGCLGQFPLSLFVCPYRKADRPAVLSKSAGHKYLAEDGHDVGV